RCQRSIRKNFRLTSSTLKSVDNHHPGYLLFTRLDHAVITLNKLAVTLKLNTINIHSTTAEHVTRCRAVFDQTGKTEDCRHGYVRLTLQSNLYHGHILRNLTQGNTIPGGL